MKHDSQPVFSEIANICRGELLGDDTSIERIETDTRKLSSEGASLFVALRGERFDGDFLPQAADAGAALC